MFANILRISLYFFISSHGFASQNICQNKICVLKCCPDEEIISNNSPFYCKKANTTIPVSALKDFKVVEFVGSSEKTKMVGKFEDFFHLDNRIFKFEFIWGNRKDLDVTELHMDGKIFQHTFLLGEEETDQRQVENYCVGWDEAGELLFGISNGESDPDNNQSSHKSFVRIAIFFVTCIFLLLVLIVYAILEQLRNFEGQMFISYIFSLLCALLLLATLGTLNFYDTIMTGHVILALSFFLYFFFMASFLWMNVISFDLWRSLRKIRVNRKLDRVCRFRVYSAYAWGVALALSINLIVLEKLDASTIPWCTKPNIIKNGSFLQGYEKLLYFYTPMMILLLCNLIFFILTVFILWRSYCDTKHIANTNQKSQTFKKRFVLYTKLSLVMGINFILEVISSLVDTNNPFWIVSDYYNLLIGPLIFIFFICKKKIFKLLRAKFGLNDKEERNVTKSSQTSIVPNNVGYYKMSQM